MVINTTERRHRTEMDPSTIKESHGTEESFLQSYDPSRYERPSVTADIVIFTIRTGKLQTLLIKRKNHPFKDKWAFPGGFMNTGKESADQAAERELYEETHVRCNTGLQQLATFSDPKRDPRTHVVSVAYTALMHESRLSYAHGDDAADARLVSVYDMLFPDGEQETTALDVTKDMLAFDHAAILLTAVDRLTGRLDYTTDALEFLADKHSFTLRELQEIHEAILNHRLDTPNFRKKVTNTLIRNRVIEPTGKATIGKNGRLSKTYRLTNH